MNAKTLVITTKRKLFGNLNGRYLSKFKGEGLDFREFREYNYQEDAKKIDFKMLAKTNKPYVREYNEEKELKILIAILKSGTLHFGIQKLKTELIAEIISILGLSAVMYDNRVSLVFLGKEKKVFKPTKSEKSIYAFVDYALNTEYLKETYSQKEIEFLNTFPKSILFIISDFYEKIDLSVLKHETYAIIVRDSEEENPTFEGNLQTVDPITFNTYSANFNPFSKKKIQKFIQKNDSYLKKEFIKNRIPFTKIYTHEEAFYKLKELIR